MKKDNENEKKLDKKKFILLVNMFLFILFVGVFFSTRSFLIMGQNNETNTVNVIVPEPTPDPDPEPKPTPEKKPNKPVIIPVDPVEDDKDETDLGIFSVRDPDAKWENITELKVFEKIIYEEVTETNIEEKVEEAITGEVIDYMTIPVVTGKIAPGVSGLYPFTIRNNTEFNIYYDVEFAETNDENINIKCKLFREKDYLFGSLTEWADTSAMLIQDRYLQISGKENYVLYWKWEHNTNDTLIGERGDVTYKMVINVTATEAI